MIGPNYKTDDINLRKDIVSSLSLRTIECQKAVTEMNEMMISSIKFVGIVLRMEQDGISGIPLYSARKQLVQLYYFWIKESKKSKFQRYTIHSFIVPPPFSILIMLNR